MALQALDEYPEDIRLVYHHLPQGTRSFQIAEALEFAGDQGKFWELHDRFVEDVPEDMDDLRDAVGDIGLDVNLFDEALNTGQYRAEVDRAIELAAEHGVDDLALFINNTEFTKYEPTFDDFKKVIEAELNEAEEGAED